MACSSLGRADWDYFLAGDIKSTATLGPVQSGFWTS
jgi:hypothetical protein